MLVTTMGLAAAALVCVTVVGLVVLWPHGRALRTAAFGTPKTLGAVVTKVADIPCADLRAGVCRRISVRLIDGPSKGRPAQFTITGAIGSIALAHGDKIRVYENRLPPDAVAAGGRKIDRYAFSDFDRRGPIVWLAVGFVSLLLLTGRLHGLRALLGLTASLLIVIEFVIPAILHGRPPLAVAVVGAFAVMLVTMPLSYGLGAKMLSAWLGTAASLLLAAGLAAGFSDLAHLSGRPRTKASTWALSRDSPFRGCWWPGW